MKFNFLLIVLLCGTFKASAQVGINTVDPKAQLDIAVSNNTAPSIMDGILIPRIIDFPQAQPTIAQHGMLVFLTTGKEGFPAGFYFWNNDNLKWTPISGNNFENFFQFDSDTVSDHLRAPIYRVGKVRIGSVPQEAMLGVAINGDSTKTGIEVVNSSLSAQHVTYSIHANNNSAPAARKYGIKNRVGAEGRGEHIGIYNESYQQYSGPIYGIFNKVGRTYGANAHHYGIYSEIGTVTGEGFAYGIYGKAVAADSSKVFAGYFEGRLAVGDSLGVKYIFPDERGEENQVLAAGQNGETKWLDIWGKGFAETGASLGRYEIPINVGTLQIGEAVQEIAIPPSSLNKNRKLVLLATAGIAFKAFVFEGSDGLVDVLTGNRIEGINGGERFVIQSTGARWIVVGE